MKQYLILVRGGMAAFAKLDEAAQGAVYGKWGAYVAALTEAGAWVSGDPLDQSGRLLCEKKEPMEGIVGEDDVAVGGYMILKAESYEAALDHCDACPSLDYGAKLEIREALEM